MKKKEENLSRQELEAFHKLREAPLPSDLEDRVINGLESENLFKKQQKEFTMKNWIYLAAASVAFFIFGYFSAQKGPQGNLQTDSQNLAQYAILLYEDDSFKGDNQGLVSEYMTWGKNWAQKGKLVDGKKLDLKARWLGNSFDPASSPGQLTGFFIIQATDYSEALSITESHPHTGYGGRIELREIEKL